MHSSLPSLLGLALLCAALATSPASAAPAAHVSPAAAPAALHSALAGKAAEAALPPSRRDLVAAGGFWDAARMASDVDFRDFEEAVWLADTEDLPRLEAIATRHIQEYPQSLRGHYLLAIISLEMAMEATDDDAPSYVGTALTLGAQCLQLDPASPFGYMLQAEALRLRGDAAEGLVVMARAKHLVKGDDWRIDFMKARLFASTWRRGLPLPIKELFEPLLLNPAASRHMVAHFAAAAATSAVDFDQEASASLMEGGAAAGDFRQAMVGELASFDVSYPDPYFKLALGGLLLDGGRPAMADGYYSMVLQAEPHNREALIALSAYLSKEGKDPRRALSYLGRYESDHADHMSARRKAVLLLLKGQAYATMGEFAAARSVYLKEAALLEGAPKEREGDYAMMAGSFKDAGAPAAELIKLAEDVTSKVEGSPILFATLAETYFPLGSEPTAPKPALAGAKAAAAPAVGKASGPTVKAAQARAAEKAVGYYLDAATLSPGEAGYHVAIGLTFFQVGRLDDAAAALTAGLDINPSSAGALYCQARIQAKRGKDKEAVASLTRAAAIDPVALKKASIEDDFWGMRQNQQFIELMKKEVKQAPTQHASCL